MPDISNTRLNTVDPAERDIQAIGVPSKSGASNYSSAIGALAKSISGISQYRDEKAQAKALGDVSGELAGIEAQSSAYNVVRDELLARMKGADKATFESLSDQLRKLRNGELQGVISPQAAAMRLGSLSKSMQNRYPTMAGDIRKLVQASSNQMATIQNLHDVDPVLKAQLETVEAAEKSGMTYDDYMASKESEAKAFKVKGDMETALYNGDFHRTDTITAFKDGTKYANFADQWGKMTGQVASGKFVKEDFVLSLDSQESQMRDAFMQYLSSTEKATGYIFRDREGMWSEIAKPFEIIKQTAEKVDSKEKQVRLAKAASELRKYAAQENLYHILGDAAVVASDPEDLVKVMEQMGEVARRVSTGQISSLEREAQFNPYAALLLGEVKKGYTGFSTLASATAQNIQGNPQAKNNLPTKYQRLVDMFTAEALGNPRSDLLNRQQKVQAVVEGGYPAEGLLRNWGKLGETFLAAPGAHTAFDKRVVEDKARILRDLPLEIVNGLGFDGEKYFYNGPKSTKGGHVNPVAGGSSIGRMSGASYQEQGLEDTYGAYYVEDGDWAANRLNEYLQVQQKYTDRATSTEQAKQGFIRALNIRTESELAKHRELTNKATYGIDDTGAITVNGKQVDASWKPSQTEAQQVIKQLSAKDPANADVYRELFTPKSPGAVDQVSDPAYNPNDFIPAQ